MSEGKRWRYDAIHRGGDNPLTPVGKPVYPADGEILVPDLDVERLRERNERLWAALDDDQRAALAEDDEAVA